MTEKDAVTEKDAAMGVARQVAVAAAFLRRRLAGDYTIDEFGFDPDLNDHLLLPVLRPLYDKWFRVQVSGLHHVPSVGGALVVANHSGVIPLDALMTTVALHDHHPAARSLRMLAADLALQTPVLGSLTRKAGHTLACTPDAERLLGGGEVVGVWPEGFKGIGKPYADRYRLQRFGRGGFVAAALRTGAPIVPCSIVGAEETYPNLAGPDVLGQGAGAAIFSGHPVLPAPGTAGDGTAALEVVHRVR